MENTDLNTNSVMPESMEAIFLGKFFTALFLFVLVWITSGIFSTALLSVFYYGIASIVLFGIVYWTRYELTSFNAGIFIVGTIVVTGGGWWLLFLAGWINLKVAVLVHSLFKQIVTRLPIST